MKLSTRPAILAASIAASIVAWLPAKAHASLLLDPTGGTVLFSDATSHDDNVISGRSLGFTGTFFGITNTTVDVSTNGNLNFSGDTSFSNGAFPDSPARIAPLWDDLIINTGDGASIIEKVSPGKFYSVTWKNIENFGSSVTRQTFQAVWFGAPTVIHGFTFKLDDIAFSYAAPVQPVNGNATVGVNKGDGVLSAVAPGTIGGLIDNVTRALLPAAQGGFILFRPNGAGSYTTFLAAPVLENSAPVGTPTDANFIVVDNVTTGGAAESNKVRSILFAEGAALRVLNTLNVTGTYAQSATGVLQLALHSTSTFDHVTVGGAATLDGAVAVTYADGFKPKRGDAFKILTAAGGVSGTFAAIIDPLGTPLLGLAATYGTNEVLLTLMQASFEDLAKAQGFTPNEQAVARGLDSVAFRDVPPPIVDYLDKLPVADLPSALDRIAPEELAAIFEVATSIANVQFANLSRRMEDLRNGLSGFSAGHFALNGDAPSYSGGFGFAGVTGPEGKSGKSVKTVVTPEPDKRWGVFLTGVGEFSRVGSDENARGSDLTTGGVTLGIDYRVCPNFAVGLNIGFVHTGVDLVDHGYTSVDGGRAGIYATAFGNGLYLDTAVTGGWNGYDTRRTAVQGAARGSTNGGELDVFVGGGYDWKHGALTVGPTASFQYSYVELESFTERGSLAPLQFGSQHAESTRSAFGLKASYDWKVRGVLVRPEIRAAWQHEYGDRDYAITASFAGQGGDRFTVHGPEIGRDSLVIGAGVAVLWNDRFSTYLYYDGEVARTNYQSHTVSAGLRVSF
jgi:outer membrane autotransporter protein